MIEFDPNYSNSTKHTLAGFKSTISKTSQFSEPLLTYDDACGASEIPASALVSILEIVAAAEYILEHHAFGRF